MVSPYHCTEANHSARLHSPSPPTSSPPTTTSPNTQPTDVVDRLPPLPCHSPSHDDDDDSIPSLLRRSSYQEDDDDDTSLSSTSLSSLLEPATEEPPEPPPTADHSRRPSNPARLNAEWQTLFRNALAPAIPTAAPLPGTPPPLPPPIHTAPNQPVGHDFKSKAPGSFRLWDGNLNGLSAKDKYAALNDLCVTLKNRHVDAIAIQEPNLDFLQATVRDAITDICKSHFDFATVVTSTTCIKAPSTWKPGGTLLIVVGKWATAVVRKSNDDLGRWSTVTLTGQDSQSVTLYSAYNVCHTTIKDAGPATVFAQQWQLLRLSGVAHPNPRKRFIADLRQDLASRILNNEAIILVGDFNERLGDDPNLMASICGEFDLLDVHDFQHGDAATVPTYIRGSKRLDYCFVTPGLAPFVRRSGVNLFNEYYHSDHRALFLDIDLKAYLGDSLPKLARPDQRFVSSRSQHVAKFVSGVYAHLMENKVFHKYSDYCLDVDVLHAPWNTANAIDDILGQAFSKAERDCSSIPQHPWSVKLHKASLKVRYWKTYLTARTTGVAQDDVLAEIATTVWPDGPPAAPSNLYVLKKVKIAAERALKRTRREADALREDFLQELKRTIATRLAPKDTDAEAAVKNIEHQLRDNKRFARIARTLKPNTSPALTKVELTLNREYVHPNTGQRHCLTTTKTIDVRKELEAAIIERNQRHFAQAEGTPFTQPPLQHINSDTGFNVYKDADDNDIVLPDTALVETATVLDILRERAQNPVTKWSPDLDFEDFISSLLHWRESTATSPSSRHLGLYKALVTAYCNNNGEFSEPYDDEDPADPPTKEKAAEILQLIHGLATSAAAHGFYLRRWIHVINVMIYKKPGVIELDKLRVIHLLEADFNLLIGVYFGRRAMYHQVDRNLLHRGQYGKPGGECQDAALSKVLHNLIAFLSKTPMGQFESDAKACFDREVMNLVFACFKSHGAPDGPLRMWEQVLKNVVHRVKTAHGISKATYKYTEDSPIHGPHQGSKGGPASCSTLTSLLIEGMDRLCHGLTFCDPAQSIAYETTTNMFIDDASNCTNSFLEWIHQPPDVANIVTMLQQDSQTWERLLWTSGGLLNLSKCLYYVVAWKFDSEGRATMLPAAEIHPPLKLTSGDDPGLAAIAHFNNDKAHRYLGDWLSTNMQMKTGDSALLETGLNFSRRLSSSSLSKRDAWIAYFAVFVPAMTYTLAVTHHSSARLRKIQSPPTRSTLSKLGFNRHTAHAVVYGPSRYGGIGFRDLAVEQGIAGLTMFIRHLRAGTQQGTLIRIALAWWQLRLGTSTPLLEDPTFPTPYDTPHLLSAHRTFLASVGGSLHIADFMKTQPAPLRSVDVCLMDAVAPDAAYKPAAKAAFNRVRLYLGVTYLSEIATADGQSIARDAWNGTRPRLSPFLWPYQPCPGVKSFRNWRRILADTFLSGTRRRVSARTLDLTLCQRLGPWLPYSEPFRAHWDAFVSPSCSSLFVATDDGSFDRHPALRTRRRPKHPVKAFRLRPTATDVALPKDAVPVEHAYEPNKIVTPVSVSPALPPNPPVPSPTRWPEYLASLPIWEKTLLTHVTFVDKSRLLAALRTNGRLNLASDGGAADLKGSFGAVLADDTSILLECAGRAYGADPRSFRSEGYGMLAIIRLTFHVVHFYCTRNRTLRYTLYCDSLSLIQRLDATRALSRPAPRRHLFSEADVELQILSAIRSLGHVDLEHIKGHQDDDGGILSWEAQLNQRCDELATEHLASATTTLPLVPFLPASIVSLTVHGVTLTHHYPTQLRTFAGLPKYRKYLCKHHHWEPEVFDLIDWPNFHACTRTVSFLKRLFILKWVNDLLPFQEQQHEYKQSPSPHCPSACGESENWRHFLHCKHPARVAMWRECKATIAKTFETWSIDPSLRRIILCWMARLADAEPVPIDNLPDEYAMLRTTQATIGADSMMFGYFAKEWIVLQNRYLVALELPHSRNQAANGIKSIVIHLLEQCHTCWLLRNSHLHGTDPNNTCSYKHLHLLAQVTELYEAAPFMLASDCDIFEIPLETRPNQSKSTLQSFYSWAKPIVQLSIAKAAEMGTRFRYINEYFDPRIPQAIFDVIL
jgi:hypothetical protein